MHVESADIWLFKQLDASLWRLADNPQNEISQNLGICVSEDIANDFDHYYKVILSKYEHELCNEYLTSLRTINDLLDSVVDWSSDSFIGSHEWENIRNASIQLCLRYKIIGQTS